jgi:hypothetical protein
MKQANANSIEAMPHLKLLLEYKRLNLESGFACKTQYIGLDSFVQRLEKDSRWCSFSGALFPLLFLQTSH